MMPRPADQTYAELLCRFKDYSLLNSCAGVLGWDERTYMPRQGSGLRGEQMALLARLAHEMLTAPVLGELITEAEACDSVKEVTSAQAANVREIRRLHDRAVK